jgi:hemerythrin-like domain-containing protein
MADVFEVLAQDHAEVKDLLTALDSSPGQREGASEAVLAARGEVAQRLIMDSSAHEAAEEQHFWPAVRHQVPKGDRFANEAISQETQAKEILDKLEKLAPADPEFDDLLAKFIPAAREHIEYEETQVWPQLRAVLTQEQADELGARIAKAKEHGPTRPHPLTPSNPAVLKTVGPVAALIDRLRDAVTGRGR